MIIGKFENAFNIKMISYIFYNIYIYIYIYLYIHTHTHTLFIIYV